MKTSTGFVVGVVLVCAASAAALAQAPAAPTKSAKAEADAIFEQRCNVCHGEKGDGAGPAGVALTPKPRSWVDAKWQASVDDARIAKVVVEGGPSVGLSPLMAPNPDLKGKDAVLAEVVKRVRAFGAAKK
jgi:mono/diheme cytochrome c family protein